MGIIGALYGRGVRQESAKDHKRWAQNPTLQKTKGGAPGVRLPSNDLTVALASFICILELAVCNPVQRNQIEQNRSVPMAKFLLALVVFSSLTLWAADNITPLNVKEGLWEMTVTHSMSGMPAMPDIPPDVLAKMPPEQRARMEAMMKGGPSTDVRKECITKEKIEKHSAFSNNRGDCTRTVVNSTGSKLEVKIHCEEKQASTDGTLVLETVGSDHVKGTMQAVTNANGHTMNMNFTFSSKYLGPACGDVK
jgi:hypothetical protein